MFLKLNHRDLEVYKAARQLVRECYKTTDTFPKEEKYGLISQIRRASVSVLLNVAEGSSRKSEKERKRFFEIARGSLVEVDAALDAAADLNYLKGQNLQPLCQSVVYCFKLLAGMVH